MFTGNHSKGFLKVLPIYRHYKNIYSAELVINSIMILFIKD